MVSRRICICPFAILYTKFRDTTRGHVIKLVVGEEWAQFLDFRDEPLALLDCRTIGLIHSR
jgi:hypothetical protein